MKFSAFVVIAAIVGFAACVPQDYCWKHSKGRGIGLPLHRCPDDMDKDGALCYKKCRPDHKAVGPVCWSKCKDGYDDDGAFCRRDAKSHGKGCCCVAGHCCRHKCHDGFHDRGCICTRDAHIEPKSSYGRGAGQPMKCSDNEDEDAGLCYHKCPEGMSGVGPVCWDHCPSGWVPCAAGCAIDKATCASKTIDMSTAAIMIAADTAAAAVGAEAATMAAQNALKVAEYASKTADYAAKLKNYAMIIMDAKKKKGETITFEVAMQLAQDTLGFIMVDPKSGTEDQAMSAAQNIDPTGVVAAVQAFYYTTCNKIHKQPAPPV